MYLRNNVMYLQTFVCLYISKVLHNVVLDVQCVLIYLLCYCCTKATPVATIPKNSTTSTSTSTSPPQIVDVGDDDDDNGGVGDVGNDNNDGGVGDDNGDETVVVVVWMKNGGCPRKRRVFGPREKGSASRHQQVFCTKSCVVSSKTTR